MWKFLCNSYCNISLFTFNVITVLSNKYNSVFLYLLYLINICIREGFLYNDYKVNPDCALLFCHALL